tara:strand:+ start:766 stop:1056 length:291 start_codon:yes stop_codon:yes gene_type:complete
MTVNWTIAQLERNTDGVVTAHWRASDVDGDHAGSAYGTCGFTPDPTDELFIAFEHLTEADVLSWIESELDVDAIEASIAAQIAESKQPAVSVGVPW